MIGDMDIAALLAPSAASGTPGTPTAPTGEVPASGEAFSDLLVAAMAVPTEVSPEAAVPTLAVAAVGAIPATTEAPVVEPANTAVPTIEVPVVEEAANPPATGTPSIDEPAVVERAPALGKKKIDAGVVPEAVKVPIEGPPDPPPTNVNVSRKDAKAEAPNAPATKQDRPENENENENDAPVAPTRSAPETAVVAFGQASNHPVAQSSVASPEAKIVVKLPPPCPAPKPPFSQAAPSNTASESPVDPDAASGLPEVDAAPLAGVGLNAPPVTQQAKADATVQSAASPVVAVSNPKKLGKEPVAKGPKLESAPDLGVVPEVTVDEPTPQLAEKAELKKATGGTEANLQPLLEAPAVAAKPSETKTAEPADSLAIAEAPAKNASAKGDGEGKPNDDRSSQQNSTPSVAPTVRTAATEKPEAGSQRPEVDRHLVVRQVADRIENLVAARPREGVTIHLEPRDLGTVTLVVKGLASALDVQMTASDSRVRESLDASRPELAQALAPRGIEIRELRVASAPSSPSGTAARDAGTNPDGRPRQQPPSQPHQPSFANPSGRSATPQARVRAPRSGRGVDLLA